MSDIKSNEKQSDISEGYKYVKPKMCFNQSFFYTLWLSLIFVFFDTNSELNEIGNPQLSRMAILTINK